jgi:putative ABC transport system permease protein
MVISKESVNYSLRSIQKRKARSFLTILSIFIGIATIFIFISFGWGLYDYINDFTTSGSADKIIVQVKGIGAPGMDDTFKLTDDDVRVVERAQGVYEATGVYAKVAEVIQGDTRKFTYLLGYDPGTPLVMEVFDIEYESGRALTNGDMGKVVLGYNYLIPDKIFPKAVGINDKITVQGRELRVVGFFEAVGNPQDDAQVYVISDMVDELYNTTNNSYAMIVAKVDPNNIDGAVANVEKNLRNERGLDEGKEDFFVQSFADMIESYSGALDVVIGFIILIALISVIVSAVNTANTMITSVLERFQEIGVLKAIGARNSEIFKIFLFESGFLGFVAGIIGVLLGWSLSSLGGKILSDLGWGFLQPHFSPVLFIGCIAFATITGAISGVVPAWRASKINAVDALRYE